MVELTKIGVVLAVIIVLMYRKISLWLSLLLATFLLGILFPILIPLLQTHPDFHYYMMLAFAGGICGVLLSPLHLCLILTREYFKADWRGVYRLIWFPVVFILLAGLLWAALFSVS